MWPVDGNKPNAHVFIIYIYISLSLSLQKLSLSLQKKNLSLDTRGKSFILFMNEFLNISLRIANEELDHPKKLENMRY